MITSAPAIAMAAPSKSGPVGRWPSTIHNHTSARRSQTQNAKQPAISSTAAVTKASRFVSLALYIDDLGDSREDVFGGGEPDPVAVRNVDPFNGMADKSSKRDPRGAP